MAKILIIDNGTKNIQALKKLLREHNVQVLDIENLDIAKSNAELVILSGGSKYSVVGTPQIFKKELDFIKTSTLPIIGICLGCELIAYAFGSILEKSIAKERGQVDIEITESNRIFDKGRARVYESHIWAIKKLGKILQGIAKSKDGWEIIKHKTKPIYGLQFHPEIHTGNTAGEEYFKKLIDSLI